MTRSMLAALLLAVASLDAAAQTATADPWRKVPAAPTTCYPDDGLADRIDKAITELNTEITRQSQVNADLRKRFDAMDMSERAQRMQAFMMKNPQEAMKILQAEQAAGAKATSDVTAVNETVKRLSQQLASDQASFKEAVDKAVKPIQDKQQVMMKTRTKPRGEAGVMFITEADKGQYLALIQQENAAYENVCASYFGAGGRFQTYLSNYRTQAIEVLHPVDANDPIVLQMSIMDSPTGGYRSTSAMQGVQTYLQVFRNVYGVRRMKARYSEN